MALNIKPLSVPSKALSQSITSASMSFKLKNIKSWARNNLGQTINLVPGDFGVDAFGVFRNETGSVMEIFQFDPATIASASITILKRGLDFAGDAVTEYPYNKLDWSAGSTIVQLGTDTPQFLQWLKDYIDGIAIAGAPDSSTTVKGIGKTSVAPASPTEPIFVGDNDNRVQFASETNNGNVEIPTTAQLLAGDDVGETGAPLVVTPAQLFLKVPIILTYTSSATWTKQLGLKAIQIKAIGAGGAGGSGNFSATQCGGGGGGGEYCEKFILASDLGSTETITIGNSSTDTTFGSLFSAKGGVVGNSAASSGVMAGGAGGSGGNAEIRLPGTVGGTSTSGLGGTGAGNIYTSYTGVGGTGGAGGSPGVAGNPGGIGAGGGGGGGNSGGGGAAGGAGGSGKMIIIEYY